MINSKYGFSRNLSDMKVLHCRKQDVYLQHSYSVIYHIKDRNQQINPERKS